MSLPCRTPGLGYLNVDEAEARNTTIREDIVKYIFRKHAIAISFYAMVGLMELAYGRPSTEHIRIGVILGASHPCSTHPPKTDVAPLHRDFNLKPLAVVLASTEQRKIRSNSVNVQNQNTQNIME